MRLKSEEVVLLKRGKPHFGKNVTKILDVVRSEYVDLTNLPFILSDLLKMARLPECSEVDVSLFTSDVFGGMQIETVEMVVSVSREEIPCLTIKRNVMGFDVILEKSAQSDMFLVTCPQLHGCITEGVNEEEAMTNIKEAIEGYLECARKHGIKVMQ